LFQPAARAGETHAACCMLHASYHLLRLLAKVCTKLNSAQIYFNALGPGGAATSQDSEPREAQFMQLG